MTDDGGARDSTALAPGAVGPAPPLTPTRRRAPDHVHLLTRAERQARGATPRVLLPRAGLPDIGSSTQRPEQGAHLVSQREPQVPAVQSSRRGHIGTTR